MAFVGNFHNFQKKLYISYTSSVFDIIYIPDFVLTITITFILTQSTSSHSILNFIVYGDYTIKRRYKIHNFFIQNLLSTFFISSVSYLREILLLFKLFWLTINRFLFQFLCCTLLYRVILKLRKIIICLYEIKFRCYLYACFPNYHYYDFQVTYANKLPIFYSYFMTHDVI